MSNDIVRDFTTANDIVSVIKFLIKKEPTNDVFDLRSKEALSKFELLNRLKEEVGLSFEVEDVDETSPTGVKNVYAPKESLLESLGYTPRYTSVENVLSELKLFLTL
jgi:nucleoside-diphosphate-sugar epimerase